jgi:exopolysaccharide production protein ExoQ
VELGLVGLVILAVTLLKIMWGHLRRLIEDIRNDESYLLFSISILLAIRSFVEIDILTPYNIGTFLFYFCAGKTGDRASPTRRPRMGTDATIGTCAALTSFLHFRPAVDRTFEETG